MSPAEGRRGGRPVFGMLETWRAGMCPDSLCRAAVEVALSMTELPGYDPFVIFDAEAARLDGFFGSLEGGAWLRPSRCAGWSIRDVLAHLAGEEAYNHACLNGDLGGFFAWLRREGVAEEGFGEFNDWCVRTRQQVPVGEVLAEWRAANAQTRQRMRLLGRAGTLQTAAGPYPAGLQALHYSSELATHADDVGVPAGPAEKSAHPLACGVCRLRAGRTGPPGDGGTSGPDRPHQR
jgi:uncharacterized protein (TIGR03083 family)